MFNSLVNLDLGLFVYLVEHVIMLLVWLAPWRVSLKDADENPESNMDSFNFTADADAAVSVMDTVLDMAAKQGNN